MSPRHYPANPYNRDVPSIGEIMRIDEEQALKKLLDRGIRIPSQPRVLLALQERLASGDFSVRPLARIIAQDPGVAALLFKAAGSPVFGCGHHHDSLEKVLMVIGVKQTLNLVQAVALATAVSEPTRKVFEVFWTRSREVARMAALIAQERVAVCNVFPDQAYMAGIFFECGIPVLMQRFPAYCEYLHLDNAACWPDVAEEDARFDLDHCTVGYLVARHWKLPDFICAAIRHHHEVPREEWGAARSLVAVLQMAVHVYHHMNRVADPLWEKIHAAVLVELGLGDDEENDFCNRIAERFIEEAQ